MASSSGAAGSSPAGGAFGDLDNAPDLGKVDSKPAMNIQLTDMNGPWVVIAEGVQGELMVEADGMVFFRPVGLLGHGVGQISLHETAIGATAFKLDLEIYAYENKPSYPPSEATRYEVAGVIAKATTEKQSYSTLTIHGGLTKVSSSGERTDAGQFSGAKMSPWDPATAKTWQPNAEVTEAFAQVFNTPFKMTSHLQRASIAPSQAGGVAAPKHLDLEKYRVGDIDSVYYVPNYVNELEEQQMLTQLNETPQEMKQKLTKRMVQEWGCSMCSECNQSFVADYTMPPWVREINTALMHDGIFTPATFPNNVRIHEYEQGEGIAPHVDGPIYVPNVAILSLASPTVMGFYPRQEPHDQPMEHYNDTFRFDGEISKNRPQFSLVLEPRSLLIFKKDAYTHHPHGISDKAVDSLAESVAGPIANRHLLSSAMANATEVARQYRVGVTVRNLLPRCSHQPERSEYCMRQARGEFFQGIDLTKPSSSSESPAPDRSKKSEPLRQSLAPKKKSTPPPFSQSMGITDPTAAVAPPSPSNTPVYSSTPSSSSSAHLESEVRAIKATQDEILRSITELKEVVAHSVATSASFQTEMSSVMNHLTSTVLELESRVDDLTEEVQDGFSNKH